MAGEPGNAPIDRVLMRIGQLQHQIKTHRPRVPVSLGDPGLREILQSLQQETEMLPPVVQGVVEQIGRKAENTVVAGAAGELEKRYRQEMLGRVQPRPGRPIPVHARTARTSCRCSDFSRLFGYGGVFDKFFNENLDPLVDRSQSPWAWRAGAPQGTRAILDQFEKALEIRDLFFRRGIGAFELKFYVTIAEADSSSIRFLLEIDGQGIEYRPPARPVIAIWPGRSTGTAARDVVRALRRSAAGWPSSVRGPGSGCSTRRVKSANRTSDRDSSSSSRWTQRRGSSSRPRACGIRSRIATGRSSAARSDPRCNAVEVGLYGKLPSHGDFLRRRTSDAFVSVWDAWLQDCLAASRADAGRSLARRLSHEPGLAFHRAERARADRHRSSA